MSDLPLCRLVVLVIACCLVLAVSSTVPTEDVAAHCDDSDEVRLMQTNAKLHAIRRDASVLQGKDRAAKSASEVAFEAVRFEPPNPETVASEALTMDAAPEAAEEAALALAAKSATAWSDSAGTAGAGDADARVAENVSATAEDYPDFSADAAFAVQRAAENVRATLAQELVTRDAVPKVAEEPTWSVSAGFAGAGDADALVAETTDVPELQGDAEPFGRRGNVSASGAAAPLPQKASLANQSHLLERESGPTSSRTCIANSGGTCRFSGCDDWRDGTTCYRGRCFCRDGLCAGADGKCHRERNDLAASGFRLQNARWADFLLHFPAHFTYIKVHNTPHTDDSELFDLYVLPGSNRTEFLLSSTVDPDRVSASETGEYGNFAATKKIANRAVDYLGVRLVRAPEYEGKPPGSVAVMISPIVMENSYYTVTAGAWEVAVLRGDYGTGAYWQVEPASALDGLLLPDFDGRACTRDCGSYGSRASAMGHAWTTVVAAWAISPIVIGLVVLWVMQRRQMVAL